MRLKRKITLSDKLSESTLANLRQYMAHFFDGRHSIERFDGQVTIDTEREGDADMLASQFPHFVTRVDNVYM